MTDSLAALCSGILGGLGMMLRPLSLTVLVFAVALVAPGLAQEWKGRARVDGRVSDENGSAVSGATVSTRTPAGGAGPEVTSGADGRFVIDGVVSGSWVLEVTAPGHPAWRIDVHLPDESSWLGPVEVRLARARPEPAPRTIQAAAREKSSTPVVATPRTGDRGVALGDGDAPAGEGGGPAGYEDVQAALASGRSDRARELAASVHSSTSGSADLFFAIGRGFLTAGETAEAVVFFGQAIERDPGHVDARYGRALGLLALGRHAEAREDLEAVRDLQPQGTLAQKAGQALEELVPSPERSR